MFLFVLVSYQREIFNEVPTEVATKQNPKRKTGCTGKLIPSRVTNHHIPGTIIISGKKKYLLLYVKESSVKLSNVFMGTTKGKIWGYCLGKNSSQRGVWLVGSQRSCGFLPSLFFCL